MKIFIQNYQSITDIEISLLEEPLFLVGYNEAGKSSILRAISILGNHLNEIHHTKKNTIIPIEKIRKMRSNVKTYFSEEIKFGIELNFEGKQYELNFVYIFKMGKFMGYQFVSKCDGQDFNLTSEKIKNMDLQVPTINFYETTNYQVIKEMFFNEEALNKLIAKNVLLVLDDLGSKLSLSFQDELRVVLYELFSKYGIRVIAATHYYNLIDVNHIDKVSVVHGGSGGILISKYNKDSKASKCLSKYLNGFLELAVR